MRILWIVGIGALLIIGSLLFKQTYILTLVKGDSMAPILHNNDLGIVRKIDRPEKLQVGDIVLAWDTHDILVIKRIAGKRYGGDDYWFFLLGDNYIISEDSRSLGWISVWRVKGILARPKDKK